MGVEPNWKAKYPCPQCAPTSTHSSPFRKFIRERTRRRGSSWGVRLFIETVEQCRCSLNEFPILRVCQWSNYVVCTRRIGKVLRDSISNNNRDRNIESDDYIFWRVYPWVTSLTGSSIERCIPMQKCANILCTTRPLWRSERLLPEIVITGKYARAF